MSFGMSSSVLPEEQRGQIDWLLKRLAGQIPGIVHAIALSADGLCTAHTDSLDTDRADQLCAMASGLVSISNGGAGVLEGGRVLYTMVAMEGGTLITMPVSDGSALGALASPDYDVSAVAYQMAVIADQIGAILTPPIRTAAPG
jgi:predicted regulator of Ras-like GTPase activity (Roadblock/LC7/MglB family)